MVTKENVVSIAKLVKLSFTEQEFDSLTSEMNSVLQYIDQLKEVDVTGILPLENINEGVEKNLFRADIVQPSLSREDALKNAPQSADGYFLVPKVLEKEQSSSKVLTASDEDADDFD